MPIPDPNKPEQHEGWCPLGENCFTCTTIHSWSIHWTKFAHSIIKLSYLNSQLNIYDMPESARDAHQ